MRAALDADERLAALERRVAELEAALDDLENDVEILYRCANR